MLFRKSNIRARELRESVTLIARYSGADDYGMQALTAGEAVAVVPASVAMMSGYAKEQYYATAEIEAYTVTLRYTCRKFEALRWGDVLLSVDSVEDEGMRHRWLVVRCHRRADV